VIFVHGGGVGEGRITQPDGLLAGFYLERRRGRGGGKRGRGSIKVSASHALKAGGGALWKEQED